jgi:hypothetical protein
VARDAALAGYPLVTTVRTMQLFAGLTGVNTLLRTAMLAGPSTRLIVAPNHDTVYAIAVLDLRAGPQALTVPSITDRYYTFQVIDAWMGTVANIGTGATKSAAGTWVVVPPGFHGTLPAGVHRVDSPSNQLFVLGRFRAVDDADAAAAHADSSRVTLQSLATYERQPGPTQAAPSMAKPVGRPQTVGANGMGFYDELAAALVANPPPNADDRRAITAVRALGVVAGGHPSTSTRSTERAELLRGLADANKRAASTALLGNHLVDGWSVNLAIGDAHQHTSLELQAVIAKHAWGPNPAAEAVYPVAITDSEGHRLTGTKDYVIHIPANQLPPVKAFWSYTVYGPDMFFVPNSIGRYSVSGQTPGLVTGPGGSLDIYLGHTAPPGHESNWLPTPAGPFRVIMRLYLPGPAVLDGTYDYPPILPVVP